MTCDITHRNSTEDNPMLQTKISTELTCFTLYNLKVGRIWKTHRVILKQIFFFPHTTAYSIFFISRIDEEWFGTIMMLVIVQAGDTKAAYSQIWNKYKDEKLK